MSDAGSHEKWVYFKYDDMGLTKTGPDRQLIEDIISLAKEEGMEDRVKITEHGYGYLCVSCPDSFDDKIRGLKWCASLDPKTPGEIAPLKQWIYISGRKPPSQNSARPPGP